MKIMLDEGAIMPTRAHPWDAGLDLYAPKYVAVPAASLFNCGYIYHKADEIRFVKGRLKFGGQTTNAPFPSMVVVFWGREMKY